MFVIEVVFFPSQIVHSQQFLDDKFLAVKLEARRLKPLQLHALWVARKGFALCTARQVERSF